VLLSLPYLPIISTGQVYQELLAQPDPDPTFHLYAACCLFYLGLYVEAEAEANKGPATRLQNRIFFHISLKRGDETKLMSHHRALSEATEDQLCLAAVHYQRAHHQVLLVDRYF
jgi:intraflagellar transport protein 56